MIRFGSNYWSLYILTLYHMHKVLPCVHFCVGISSLQKNGLGNQKEASDLTEAVKQILYENCLQAYSESNR
jgi:hypothetical protein